MRAYAIRPYTYSLKIKRIIPKHILEKIPFNHTASAINTSFANMRAYAIRPYTSSLKIKRIFPILILENSPFNHTAPAINTCSFKFKYFGVETMNGN